MITCGILVFSCVLKIILAYKNTLYTIVPPENEGYLVCGGGLGGDEEYDTKTTAQLSENTPQKMISKLPVKDIDLLFQTVRTTTQSKKDPFLLYHKMKRKVLLGLKPGDLVDFEEDLKEKEEEEQFVADGDIYVDDMAHYPSGSFMRAELFQKKKGVHLPMPELIHRRHCFLNITDDYMQTAVDAFSIFLEGSVDDIYNLPSMYVLKSARAISMMNIEKEKLVATWDVVKDNLSTISVPYHVLEMYRPLFKYLSGREMARLNLTDDRILAYIGTHAELDRHQVGVVAAKYIRLNSDWAEPKYLNLMNNLLCGVPMTFMRKVPESVYLQLTQQVFYHIRACDPLQRRFYFSMMTRTQALGKSYSWSARDVARLGLLIAEVQGPNLAAVNPEAMAGITSQVMLQIPADRLIYITEMQLRYLGQKPLNILAKKLRSYREQFSYTNYTEQLSFSGLICVILYVLIVVMN